MKAIKINLNMDKFPTEEAFIKQLAEQDVPAEVAKDLYASLPRNAEEALEQATSIEDIKDKGDQIGVTVGVNKQVIRGKIKTTRKPDLDMDVDQQVLLKDIVSRVEQYVGQTMPKQAQLDLLNGLNDRNAVSASINDAIEIARERVEKKSPDISELLNKILDDLGSILSDDELDPSEVTASPRQYDPYEGVGKEQIIVKDMVVRKKGTQEFYKVISADDDGNLDLLRVADVVDSEDRMIICANHLNYFLNDFDCVWDPRNTNKPFNKKEIN